MEYTEGCRRGGRGTNGGNVGHKKGKRRGQELVNPPCVIVWQGVSTHSQFISANCCHSLLCLFLPSWNRPLWPLLTCPQPLLLSCFPFPRTPLCPLPAGISRACPSHCPRHLDCQVPSGSARLQEGRSEGVEPEAAGRDLGKGQQRRSKGEREGGGRNGGWRGGRLLVCTLLFYFLFCREVGKEEGVTCHEFHKVRACFLSALPPPTCSFHARYYRVGMASIRLPPSPPAHRPANAVSPGCWRTMPAGLRT